MLDVTKTRAIRNYCSKQGLLGCFNYDGTCKLSWYCEQLCNIPVALWTGDITDTTPTAVEVLYHQLNEIQN